MVVLIFLLWPGCVDICVDFSAYGSVDRMLMPVIDALLMDVLILY